MTKPIKRPTPATTARPTHAARPHAYGTVYAPTILPTERPPVLRPGSTDHEQHPSRRGGLLHYRDGRVEKVLP